MRMANTVKPVPAGYHSITPYLVIQEAAEAIEYYKQLFGAREHLRITMPDGNVGHTELEICDSVIFTWIVYTSREHRDVVNKKVIADPRIKAQGPEKMPFDCKRMAYAGFRTIVEF
jgi:uncharacterized protein YbaA (DUF1428 family)